MADVEWAFELENLIYSKVKVEATKVLKPKFPKIYFTTSNMNKGEPVYPTVYIHELPGTEMGADLNGQDINAVMETLQVEVISDTSQADVSYITKVIASIFKSMRFQIMSMPEFSNGETYYRKIMRCRRIIGNADTL